MKYIKENWKELLFMSFVCIIGVYFATVYTLNSYDKSIVEEGIKQVGSKELLIIISTIQGSLYAIAFACIGIILSNKVGLWKKFEKNKKAIVIVLIVSIIGGLAISVFDKYVFGSFISPVLHFYDDKPTIDYVIMALTYGGVFEEILIRLFLMSLFIFIISKVFYRKKKEIPTKVFVIANVMSALLFAAGHIPSTILLFGYVDALILFRCFLLNGGLGLSFGYLYRKYGIWYAMLAHFGIHFISKIIWLLFI